MFITDEFGQEIPDDDSMHSINDGINLPDPEPMEIDLDDSSGEEEPSRSSSSLKASSSEKDLTPKELGARGIIEAIYSGEKEGDIEPIFAAKGDFSKCIIYRHFHVPLDVLRSYTSQRIDTEKNNAFRNKP